MDVLVCGRRRHATKRCTNNRSITQSGVTVEVPNLQLTDKLPSGKHITKMSGFRLLTCLSECVLGERANELTQKYLFLPFRTH
jgi:hypothetical protein